MDTDITLNFIPPLGGEDVIHEVYRGKRLIGYLVPNPDGEYAYEASRAYVVRDGNQWDAISLRHIADKLDEVNRGRQTEVDQFHPTTGH